MSGKYKSLETVAGQLVVVLNHEAFWHAGLCCHSQSPAVSERLKSRLGNFRMHCAEVFHILVFRVI